MKKAATLFFFFFYSIIGFAQDSDTTQYLFKNLNYSYFQYTIGYEGMSFGPHDFVNGINMTILGAAFGNKISFGADVDMANRTPNSSFSPGTNYPQTAAFVGCNLFVEPLIRPKKLINFSIPIKFGIANTSRWDTAMDFGSQWNGSYYSSSLNYQVNQYSDNLVMTSVGVNCFVNLWKPVSLGVGASYRYSINMQTSNHADKYSGVSTFVLLRFKWDTRAYYQKAFARQKAYMETQGQ